MIEGHTLITAFFADNERTSVEIYFSNDNPTGANDEQRVEFCPAVDGDEMYDWLLTQMSIDDIHEATYKHIKDQDAIYREAIIEVAKVDGLLYDPAADKTDTAALLKRVLFDFSPEKHRELLFQFKLQVFELDAIKESSNTKAKAKIRKAESILDVVKEASKLI